jgi:MoaA/NifB/PqqE/SkfB family radical SAM enzyme
MRLSGLHLLLTYQCNLECDHCFVWGSPWQSGTMTLRNVRNVLQQAKDVGTIEWIYFEGGEPFLYYATLLKAVQEAASMGFQVGIVSNGYWATDVEDALEWLRPFAGLVQDLSISSDLYHWSERLSQQAKNAGAAAEQLGIPLGVISVAEPEATNAASAVGQLPAGESAVMYRGRAAEKLVPRAARRPWERFTECPYEDLREPGRVHVDPFGNLHICQGISLGNLFDRPLREICDTYDPDAHAITGALLEGGPAELVRRYELPHEERYADACHLCCEACRALRERFPEILMPDQMYGVVEGW